MISEKVFPRKNICKYCFSLIPSTKDMTQTYYHNHHWIQQNLYMTSTRTNTGTVSISCLIFETLWLYILFNYNLKLIYMCLYNGRYTYLITFIIFMRNFLSRITINRKYDPSIILWCTIKQNFITSVESISTFYSEQNSYNLF
jgi:hypothetical protein